MPKTATLPTPAKLAARATYPVLIVDDESSLRRAIGLALQGTAYTLVEAETGEASLTICRAGFRGIILMDICMGVMSGWETIRALAEEGLLEGSLVCLLTGTAIPPVGCEGIAGVVFDYLPKPFTRAALRALLDNASQHFA